MHIFFDNKTMEERFPSLVFGWQELNDIAIATKRDLFIGEVGYIHLT